MAPSRRKQSTQPNNTVTPPQSEKDGKQQSISSLFSCSELKRTASSDLSPSSKRAKVDNQAPVQTLSTAAMYNFSSGAKGHSNEVVDLTNESPSPRPRRMSVGTHKLAQPSFGAKKLVVKNLKTSSQSNPNNYCEQTSQKLDNALTAIFSDQRPVLSNEELYRGVENICKLGQADQLTRMLFGRCQKHVKNDFGEPLAARGGEKPVEVLRAVVTAWAAWNQQMMSVRAIFFYLDRAHLLQSSNPSLNESSVAFFRTNVFGQTMITGKATDGACDLLLADRTQQSPEPTLFKNAIKMFHELGVYTTEFEPKMLGLSQKYISTWAEKHCTESSLAEYVRGCVELIEAEVSRCDYYDLDTSTRRDLVTLLETHLVELRQGDLTDKSSVAELLTEDMIDDLSQLYRLLARRRLGAKLREPFTAWIDSTGTAIVFDDKGQDAMVVRLLELKLKLDRIWRSAFQRNQDIGHGLREAFEAFINKSKKTNATWNTDNSKPGEMIAKYVDRLLRSGAKAIPTSVSATTVKGRLGQPAKSVDKGDEDNDDDGLMDEESEVDHQLDQVLDLFRFVHGKAVFEAFYKKDLARRLLMGRSASNDAEKSMLNRLKEECGSGFTHNLEQMFRDVELARDEMGGYKQRIEHREVRPAVDLSVNILSAAAWPTYPDVPVIIPAEIKRCVDDFANYYQMKHTGRKLSWKHALAHCIMKANFPKGNKEIVLSSFQAIVLLLFNGLEKDEELSYERIKAESGLSDVECKRTLQSLACAKLRPLTKHPKGREIDDKDTFSVNMSFHNEKYRIKINAIQLKQTQEENKETHLRVAEDRQYETQAAIVRIMKSRKTIQHAELIAETIKATKNRGVLQPADIKRNIDKLIDKEYMERMEGNAYSYLA